MAWTDERVERLKLLWQKGHTARQIAESLGEGISRNAVIGKANRLGLSQPSKAPRKPKPEPVIVEPSLSDAATILSLTPRSCRWPLGDPSSPEFRFCGAHARVGEPYCEYHARMAYQPASARDSRRQRSA